MSCYFWYCAYVINKDGSNVTVPNSKEVKFFITARLSKHLMPIWVAFLRLKCFNLMHFESSQRWSSLRFSDINSTDSKWFLDFVTSSTWQFDNTFTLLLQNKRLRDYQIFIFWSPIYHKCFQPFWPVNQVDDRFSREWLHTSYFLHLEIKKKTNLLLSSFSIS